MFVDPIARPCQEGSSFNRLRVKKFTLILSEFSIICGQCGALSQQNEDPVLPPATVTSPFGILEAYRRVVFLIAAKTIMLYKLFTLGRRRPESTGWFGHLMSRGSLVDTQRRAFRGAAVRNPREGVGGYHLVWARDLGSATPLAWTNAQFIRLAIASREAKAPEVPGVVRAHFQSSASPRAQ